MATAPTQDVLDFMSYRGDMYLGILDSSLSEPNYDWYVRRLVIMSDPVAEYRPLASTSIRIYNTNEIIFGCDWGTVDVTMFGFYTGPQVGGSLILCQRLSTPIRAESGDTITFRPESLDATVGKEDWLARLYSAPPTEKDIILTGRNVRVRSHGKKKDQTQTPPPVYTRRIRTMGRGQDKG